MRGVPLGACLLQPHAAHHLLHLREQALRHLRGPPVAVRAVVHLAVVHVLEGIAVLRRHAPHPARHVREPSIRRRRHAPQLAQIREQDLQHHEAHHVVHAHALAAAVRVAPQVLLQHAQLLHQRVQSRRESRGCTAPSLLAVLAVRLTLLLLDRLVRLAAHVARLVCAVVPPRQQVRHGRVLCRQQRRTHTHLLLSLHALAQTRTHRALGVVSQHLRHDVRRLLHPHASAHVHRRRERLLEHVHVPRRLRVRVQSVQHVRHPHLQQQHLHRRAERARAAHGLQRAVPRVDHRPPQTHQVHRAPVIRLHTGAALGRGPAGLAQHHGARVRGVPLYITFATLWFHSVVF